MEITVLGCRGSAPATGSTFDRYGGETSSVAVARSGESPALVLDAGTGLRSLDRLLGADPFRGSILLSHLHWDHTHGLPFCPAMDRADAVVDLYVPDQGVDPLQLLSRAIGPPHFPITPDQLRGTWRFHTIGAGRLEIDGFDVIAADVRHKGGRTLGYRVSDGESSVAYIPDYWEAQAEAEPAELVSGADLLFHDAQHLASEMGQKGHLGHSSVEYAVDLAGRHDVDHFALFHHDPSRTDAELDDIIAWIGRGDLDVSAAAIGRTYSTDGGVRRPSGASSVRT